MIGVPWWVFVLARHGRRPVCGSGGGMWWWRREPAAGVPVAVRRAHVGRHWRGVSLAELRARWEREAAGPVEEWPTEQFAAVPAAGYEVAEPS